MYSSPLFSFLRSFTPLRLPQQVSLPLELLLERSGVMTHEQGNIKVIMVSQPLQVLIGA